MAAITVKIRGIRYLRANIFEEITTIKGTHIILETPYDDYLYDLETHKSFTIIPCPYMEDKEDRWQIIRPASLNQETICNLLSQSL